MKTKLSAPKSTLLSRVYLVLLLFLFSIGHAVAQVHVKGYYRSNGTYVRPHYRSSPDGNPYNNYSYPGNTNPYTGKVAQGNPDTYLRNYYNRSGSSPSTTATSSNSSYAPSTYTPPVYAPSTSSTSPYISSPPSGTYSTYGPSYGSTSTSVAPGYSGSSYSGSGNSTYSSSDISEGNSELLSALIYKVTSPELNAREFPNIDANILYVLQQGESVMVVSVENYPWCKVIFYYDYGMTNENKIGSGFVHSKYLSKSYAPSASNMTSSNNTHVTKTYPINIAAPATLPYKTSIADLFFDPPLLDGPSADYSEILKCKSGEQVIVLEKGSLYYKVKIHGIVGYISKYTLASY